MKRKSKPGYNLYSLSTLRFKKMMVKAGYKKLKNATIPEASKEIFESPVANNLDKHLLVTETLWSHDGRHVIFPGNENFFDSLLKSNFSLEGGAALSLPYSTFILATPKNFVVAGVKIPSAIIKYESAHQRRERYNLASELMKLPEMSHEENTLAGKDSLSFFYQDPYEEEGVIVQVNQTPEQLAGALSTNSPEEYRKIIGEIPKDMVSPFAQSPSDTDNTIQYVLAKLVAGISVYLSAGGVNRLNDGLPNNGALSIGSLKTNVKYSFSHLPVLGRVSEPDQEGSIGVRRFHFRQLRAPVYYQNQHKDLAPGSRWVFVKESQIGSYTAKNIS